MPPHDRPFLFTFKAETKLTDLTHFHGASAVRRLLFAIVMVMSGNHALAAPNNIIANNSNLCVGVVDGSSAYGANVVQMNCGNADHSKWSFVPLGNGYYHIVAQSSGQCMNVSGGTGTNGTQIIQWPCQPLTAYNDQWTVQPSSGGHRIVSRASGMCLNIFEGSWTPGASVIQWPCQGAADANDQFQLTATSTSLPSAWSTVIPLPVNPIGLANLPNGKLLMWSASQQFGIQGDAGGAISQTYYALFDPKTNFAAEALETSAGSDMFCPGTAMLANGQLLVNGGSSSPKTSLYNWATNTWSAAATMKVPRGYQGDTLLSNGSVFTLGGSWSGGVGGKTAEVWSAASGWTLLPGVPDTNILGPDPQGIYRGDNHLWLFAQSNGTVFHAGPSAQMNWISTSGTGSIQSAGNRGTDPYSMNGNAVLYDIGKILKVGGAPAYEQQAATSAAYTIDISRGFGQSVVVNQLAGMNYRRAMGNSVVLPDGGVVVVGGMSTPVPFSDSGAVLVPEIWNPITGKFTPLKPMQTPRTYHSTALLMADGRVFAGGGGQCGAGCAANHLNAEILTPPYLLNADGSAAVRPVIQTAPTSATRGQSISVTTNSPVSSFALMRLAAVTHTVNNDQRRIPLQSTATGATSYNLAIPADAGVVLPGYYMLFALNLQGVPSVSTSIRIP